jgi:hypothetical protein
MLLLLQWECKAISASNKQEHSISNHNISWLYWFHSLQSERWKLLCYQMSKYMSDRKVLFEWWTVEKEDKTEEAEYSK